MPELMYDLSGVLTLVLALTLATNLVVQVLKGLVSSRVPTNLLAFLVAVAVTFGTGYGLWVYYGFALTGWMVVAFIALAFAVAYAAMFGYDKLMQLVEQAGGTK